MNLPGLSLLAEIGQIYGRSLHLEHSEQIVPLIISIGATVTIPAQLHQDTILWRNHPQWGSAFNQWEGLSTPKQGDIEGGEGEKDIQLDQARDMQQAEAGLELLGLILGVANTEITMRQWLEEQ